MRQIYTLFLRLCLPLIFIRLGLKSLKNPAYRKHLGQRVGFAPSGHQKPTLWLHAVSLGEAIAASSIISSLLARYPKADIYVTTTTPTGREHIQKTFANKVLLSYFPYDIPSIWRRFFKRVNPACLIIMETELWPNLLHQCQQHGCKVMLANARLSAKSYANYARLRSLSYPMIQKIDQVCAQFAKDGQRFIALGLPANRLAVCGNIKFDMTIDESVVEHASKLRTQWAKRPVWIAASTHQGEEALILSAHQALIKHQPNTLLILVPRHPERFKTVEKLCRQRGLSLVRRSDQQPCNATTQVFLGDTMGELLLLYACAQVAFVGGSLVPVGGHNMLEPAAFALPIISGPHTRNFAHIATMLKDHKALISVVNTTELSQHLSQLLSHAPLRQQMGQAAQKIVTENKGALKKICHFIDSLLDKEKL